MTAIEDARDMLYESALAYYWPHDTNAGDTGAEEAFARAKQLANGDVDAYRNALLAEVMGWAEEIKMPYECNHGTGCECGDWVSGHNDALDTLLDKIRETYHV